MIILRERETKKTNRETINANFKRQKICCFPVIILLRNLRNASLQYDIYVLLVRFHEIKLPAKKIYT